MSEVKSKEQIIESYPNHNEYPSYYHESAIELMMDQWAKQSIISFCKKIYDFNITGENVDKFLNNEIDA